jgi:hypothetical protein
MRGRTRIAFLALTMGLLPASDEARARQGNASESAALWQFDAGG